MALHRAECEFLTGEQATAKTRLAELARRAATLPDLAAVTRLQMEPSDRDVEVALDYLRRVGDRLVGATDVRGGRPGIRADVATDR